MHRDVARAADTRIGKQIFVFVACVSAADDAPCGCNFVPRLALRAHVYALGKRVVPRVDPLWGGMSGRGREGARRAAGRGDAGAIELVSPPAEHAEVPG